MPSFNLDIDVVKAQIAHSDGDDVVRLIQIVGFDAPVPTPQGIAGVKIGFGTVSSVLDREMLAELIAEAQVALEALPEEKKDSGLVVATNMNQAKGFADTIQAATGGKV